jgi:hypothetical protein
MKVAHHQSDQFFNLAFARIVNGAFVAGAWRRQQTLKAKYAEASPAGGKIRLGDLLHAFKSHHSILRCAD